MYESTYERRKSIGLYIMFSTIPFWIILPFNLKNGCLAMLHPFICVALAFFLVIPRYKGAAAKLKPLDDKFGLTDTTLEVRDAPPEHLTKMVFRIPTLVKWVVAFGTCAALFILVNGRSSFGFLKFMVSGWDPSLSK